MDELNKLKEHYSLYKIAKLIGASYTTVWRWKEGVHVISATYLKKIKKELKEVQK